MLANVGFSHDKTAVMATYYNKIMNFTLDGNARFELKGLIFDLFFHKVICKKTNYLYTATNVGNL